MLTKFCSDMPLVKRVLGLTTVSGFAARVAPPAIEPTAARDKPISSNLVIPSADRIIPEPSVPESHLNSDDAIAVVNQSQVSQVLCTSPLRGNRLFEHGLNELAGWEDSLWLQECIAAQKVHVDEEHEQYERTSTYVEAVHMRDTWKRRLLMAQGTLKEEKENVNAQPSIVNTSAIANGEKRALTDEAVLDTHPVAGPSNSAKRARL